MASQIRSLRSPLSVAIEGKADVTLTFWNWPSYGAPMLRDPSSLDTPLDFRLPGMAFAFVWTCPSVAERCVKVRVRSTALSSRLEDPSKRAFSSIDSDR